jgi:hypothetical protein
MVHAISNFITAAAALARNRKLDTNELRAGQDVAWKHLACIAENLAIELSYIKAVEGDDGAVRFHYFITHLSQRSFAKPDHACTCAARLFVTVQSVCPAPWTTSQKSIIHTGIALLQASVQQSHVLSILRRVQNGPPKDSPEDRPSEERFMEYLLRAQGKFEQTSSRFDMRQVEDVFNLIQVRTELHDDLSVMVPCPHFESHLHAARNAVASCIPATILMHFYGTNVVLLMLQSTSAMCMYMCC